MDIILHFQSKKAALFKKSAVQSKFNHLKRDPRAHKEKKNAHQRDYHRESERESSRMRRVPPRSRLTRVCICPTGKGGLILVSFFLTA